MRKKYLSALLFGALVMASTVTFTSCIDNDEPAGIENLRGAKAELLRAKVAVEQADAAYKLAQAEHEKANATYRLAEARYKEAEAKKIEAEAAQAEAKTEADKAYYAQQAAFYKNLMEEQAETHKATMVQKQQAYAEAVRAYEIAMKEIEIAKALMSDQEKVTLAELEQAVNTAKGELETAMGEVETAEENLYNEMMIKAQYGTSAITGEKYDYIPQLELKLARKQAALTTAKETLAKWNEIATSSNTITDLKAEVAQLEDSIKDIEVIVNKYDIKIVKFVNSDEYKAAENAVTTAQYEQTNAATPEEYKYVFKFNAAENAENTDGSNKIVVGKDTRLTAAKAVLETNKARVETALGKYTTQYIAMLLENKAGNATDVAAKKKDYENKVEAWKKATTAYNDVKDLSYDQTAKIEALRKAVKSPLEIVKNTTIASAAPEQLAAAKAAIAKAALDYYTAASVVKLTTKKYSFEVFDATGASAPKDKTVAEWLAIEGLGGYYLDKIITDKLSLNWNNLSDQALANLLAGPNFVASEKNAAQIKADALAALVNASNAAFGTAFLTGEFNDNYMRVQPTEDEINAYVNENGYTNAGAAGVYYVAISPTINFKANNYEAIMADYTAAIEFIDEKLEAIKTIKDEKEAAVKKAQADLKVFTDQEQAMRDEQGVYNDRIDALDDVKNTILGIVDTMVNGDSSTAVEDAADIDTLLKGYIEDAENDVIAAEKAVARAEVNLQKAKDGKYDGVAEAQKELDEANEDLKAAQEAYDKALADLKTGLDIMAKSAE